MWPVPRIRNNKLGKKSRRELGEDVDHCQNFTSKRKVMYNFAYKVVE